MQVSRKQLVNAARQYIGVKFQHLGRQRTSREGIDCAGLLILTINDIGIRNDLLKINNYSIFPKPTMMRTYLQKYCDIISFNSIKDGDIMYMTFIDYPQHLAFKSTMNNIAYMIHSYSTIGKVVEHRLNQKWINRIAECYRIKGVTWLA